MEAFGGPSGGPSWASGEGRGDSSCPRAGESQQQPPWRRRPDPACMVLLARAHAGATHGARKSLPEAAHWLTRALEVTARAARDKNAATADGPFVEKAEGPSSEGSCRDVGVSSAEQQAVQAVSPAANTAGRSVRSGRCTVRPQRSSPSMAQELSAAAAAAAAASVGACPGGAGRELDTPVGEAAEAESEVSKGGGLVPGAPVSWESVLLELRNIEV